MPSLAAVRSQTTAPAASLFPDQRTPVSNRCLTVLARKRLRAITESYRLGPSKTLFYQEMMGRRRSTCPLGGCVNVQPPQERAARVTLRSKWSISSSPSR